MIQQIVDITKSNAGFFGGLARSKKYFLAVFWAVTCIAFATEWKVVAPRESVYALLAGSVVLAAFIVSQGLVEREGARAAGSQGRNQIDLRTKEDFRTGP